MTTIDERYYVNVADLMLQHIPEPRLRKKFAYTNEDGFIPIITVEVDV